MENDEIKNCWEFMDCDLEVRNSCPAYTQNKGTSCYAVASSYCLSRNKKLKFKYCPECPWFKKHSELVFRNIVSE